MKVLFRVIAWVAAVVTTTVLGSVVQTQFNLAELADIGAPVGFGLRLTVTGQDLAGFTPSFAPLVAAGFLVAFLVTGLIRFWVKRHGAALYALAGATALFTMFMAMEIAFGMTAIAAVRGAFGFAAMVATGAAGGWVFHAIASRR